MFYLIDGYNLLYALGILHKRMGPDGLEKARRNLLGVLHGAFGNESANVTVVFDAAHPRPGASAETEYHGVHVRFAIGMAAADDLIEALIQEASAPRHLTVVSDDHRIQKAARRKHCVVLDCGDFLEELERRRRATPVQPGDSAAKPSGVSHEETQGWLREFADLADDPALKELQDPPEFFEEEGPDEG
jgi:predicted RNA-binding protein with PIN domain